MRLVGRTDLEARRRDVRLHRSARSRHAASVLVRGVVRGLQQPPHPRTDQGDNVTEAAKEWVAVYFRYQNEYRQREHDMEGAVQYLAQGEDHEQLSARAIIRPDGSEIVGGELNGLIHEWLEDART
jgi:hypothetical protein